MYFPNLKFLKILQLQMLYFFFQNYLCFSGRWVKSFETSNRYRCELWSASRKHGSRLQHILVRWMLCSFWVIHCTWASSDPFQSSVSGCFQEFSFNGELTVLSFLQCFLFLLQRNVNSRTSKENEAVQGGKWGQRPHTAECWTCFEVFTAINSCWLLLCMQRGWIKRMCVCACTWNQRTLFNLSLGNSQVL